MDEEKEERMGGREGINLTDMFPKKVILLSTQPLTRVSILPYKLAHSYLKSTDKKLVWVTADQPAEKILDIFEEFGLGIQEFKERMIVIDLVSTGAGVQIPEKIGFKVHYVENPNNMAEVSMLFSDVFSDQTIGLAVIDSVNGLLAFNPLSSIIKFLRFLPVIALRTNTTIMLNYIRGQFGEDLEAALQIVADASLIAERNEILIKTRIGSERIPIEI